MRQLRLILATRFVSILCILQLGGCGQNAITPFGQDKLPVFDAGEIDLENATVRGLPFESIQGVQVKLTARLRRFTSGTPVIGVGDGAIEEGDNVYADCINLIIEGGAQNFRDGGIGPFVFAGRFELLSRFDLGAITYIEFDGIQVTPSCQVSYSAEQYPYFVVRDIEGM